MNLFELYWSWYEDYTSYLYVHANKTQEEFEQDVNSLIKKHFKDYVESEKNWCGTNDLVDYISDKMPDLGYTPVSPNKHGFWGGYIWK